MSIPCWASVSCLHVQSSKSMRSNPECELAATLALQQVSRFISNLLFSLHLRRCNAHHIRGDSDSNPNTIYPSEPRSYLYIEINHHWLVGLPACVLKRPVPTVSKCLVLTLPADP